MTGFWKNVSWVLESRGKVMEIFVTRRVGTLFIVRVSMFQKMSGKICALNRGME